MLKITIKSIEYFNSKTNKFYKTNNGKDLVVNLEHSLYSISKWESHYQKPFLADNTKTIDELLYYIECMSDNEIPNDMLETLPADIVTKIANYIENPMTASNYKLKDDNGGDETPTSELIYYEMFSFRIPKECEHWFLNRLLMLLTIFAIKNQPEKKLSKREALKQYDSTLAHNRRILYGK